MIKRIKLLQKIHLSLKQYPVTALLGPRQCGKTTLALSLKQGRFTYFDLENPVDLARLQNPLETLGPLKGLVVIDEIQRLPKLFEVLRVFSDRKPIPARFLILGSASPELIRRSSESLAGRVGFVDMGGFSTAEIESARWRRLWVRGGFPKSFLARSDRESESWRENFIRTFLERDIPQFGIRIPAMTLRRFWTMIAHYHGQLWNGSEIGASLGIAHTTSRQYLDILTGAFMTRQVAPWFQNVGKRVVKSPKIYLRDSGLLHSLLQIKDLRNLEGHPKLGASWEGFVVEQILGKIGQRDTYFWATHAGAELDLLVIRKGKRWGIEIKYSDAPGLTRSMSTVMEDLKLHRLWVVYPGNTRYSLGKNIECIGLDSLEKILADLQ